MFEQRSGQGGAGRDRFGAFEMGELVDVGDAVLHRPELRCDGGAFRVGHAQPNAPRCAFLFCEAAQEIGFVLARLPAFGVDAFVMIPSSCIEILDDFDLDLLRFALECGAQASGAAGPVLRKAAAPDVQHMVLVALVERHGPSGRAEGAGEAGGGAVFVGQRPEDNARCLALEVAGENSERCVARWPEGCVRTPGEGVPVAQRFNTSVDAVEREPREGTLCSRFGFECTGARLGEQGEPLRPVEGGRGSTRAGWRLRSLHNSNLLVIATRLSIHEARTPFR